MVTLQVYSPGMYFRRLIFGYNNGRVQNAVSS